MRALLAVFLVFFVAFGLAQDYEELENQATTQAKAGNYAQALALYLKAIPLHEAAVGLDSPEIASAYNNLAIIYYGTGNYPKSIEYFSKALRIKEKLLGTEHPSTLSSYNNLGEVYRIVGDYPKAIEFLGKALEIREKILGGQNLDTARTYNNLGSLYYNVGDYPKAIEFHLKALEIREKILGTQNPDTAASYNNLGEVYRAMQDYPKATEYLSKAIEIKEKVFGKQNPITAGSYNNLGLVYENLGDYPNAIEFLGKALEIREKVLGIQHLETAGSYNNLGLVYKDSKDFPKALEYFLKAMKAYASFQSGGFSALDASGRIGLNDSIRFALRNYLDIFNEYPASADSRSSALSVWSSYKGSAFDLENSLGLLRNIPQLGSLLDQYATVRQRLAALYIPQAGDAQQAQSNQQSIAALTQQQSELEVALARQSASFQQSLNLRSISAQNIQSQLSSDELFMDFVWLGDTLMVFTLNRAGQVGLYPLSKAEEVSRLTLQFRTALQENQSTSQVLPLASMLYRMLLAPLAPELAKYKSLLISPDGPLNFLPFELLHDGARFMLEGYAIRYTPTARDFLRIRLASRANANPSVIFGNPDFKGTAPPQASASRSADIDSIAALLSREAFAPLPFTASEAIGVAKLLDCNNDSCLFLEARANQQNLMAVHSPRVLHLATHGFFIKGAALPNPLLRVGIALSGARSGVVSGDGNGILTGLQLASLDLGGTELVVLSACETGLGDIVDGEGVAGLSRALILAGTKQVMMSLWKVPDQETKQLITAFYTGYSKGIDPVQALREAKLGLLKKGLNPYYWGAFVLNGR